jgi:hypothetical protein
MDVVTFEFHDDGGVQMSRMIVPNKHRKDNFVSGLFSLCISSELFSHTYYVGHNDFFHFSELGGRYSEVGGRLGVMTSDRRNNVFGITNGGFTGEDELLGKQRAIQSNDSDLGNLSLGFFGRSGDLRRSNWGKSSLGSRDNLNSRFVEVKT